MDLHSSGATKSTAVFVQKVPSFLQSSEDLMKTISPIAGTWGILPVGYDTLPANQIDAGSLRIGFSARNLPSICQQIRIGMSPYDNLDACLIEYTNDA
jgi:hypothetical protein